MAPLLLFRFTGKIGRMPYALESLAAFFSQHLVIAGIARALGAPVKLDAWFALFAPAGTPATTIQRLYSAVSTGLTTEAAAKAIVAQGMTLALRTPVELAAWLPGASFQLPCACIARDLHSRRLQTKVRRWDSPVRFNRTPGSISRERMR